MAASTVTAVAYALKKLYPDKGPENMATRRRVLYSLLRKEGGFTGDGTFSVPAIYANPGSVSTSFSTAQGASASSKGVKWAITRIAKYGVITLSGEFLLATKDDKGAFLRGLQSESDRVIDEVGHRTAIDLYGDGTGIIGRRSSASTNVITLTSADDVKHFSVGMTVGATANSDGTSARTGTTTVASVDEDGITVTLTSAAAITSFADNDYLFLAGDNAAVLAGLEAWNPLTAPSATTFFGVDRTADLARLSGSRLNSTSSSIEENLMSICATVANRGNGLGNPAAFLNPTNWANLAKSLGTKVLRDQGGEATAGFAKINVATAAGMVPVYSDPECPTTRGRLVDLDALYIKYLGPAFPHIVDDDSNLSIRVYNDDAIEVRVRQYGNLVCTNTSRLGVFAI